jgi:hypothetical protein
MRTRAGTPQHSDGRDSRSGVESVGIIRLRVVEEAVMDERNTDETDA